MSTVNEEIAAVKAKISDLEKRIAAAEMEIAAAEMGGRSEAYIINLGQQLVSTKNVLVATKNELVELRRVEVEHIKVEVELKKKENILLENRQAVVSVDSLYSAIMEAKVEGNIISLEGDFVFPVENEDFKGGVLLLRQAHFDLWKIFEEYVIKRRDYIGLLCLGPSGIGKSWASMYFLVQAVKSGRTVVFESVPQGSVVWVFASSGSRLIRGPADRVNCPELTLKSTLHIFDAKAGGYEPSASSAMLAEFSSTNHSNYKQTERRRIYKAFYPSITIDEFYNYVSLLGVDVEKAHEIAYLLGTGKVRPLSLKLPASSIVSGINEAISRLDFNRLNLYISSASPQDETRNSQNTNPATLFDVHINSEDFPDGSLQSLHDQYLFWNGVWSWCSYYVISRLIQNYGKNVEKLLVDYFQTVGNTASNKSMGVLIGHLFEHFAPTVIAEHGIECKSFGDQDLSIEDRSDHLVIKPGLIVQYRFFSETEKILEECTDTQVLYHFGNNTHGFDSFNPPNNFFNMASTLTSSDKHPVLYTVLEACSRKLIGQSVNIILIIPKIQELKWTSPPSVKINCKQAVSLSNMHEEEKQSQLVLNGQRSMKSLPESVKNGIRNIKFYKGSLDITSMRSFSSCSARINMAHRTHVPVFRVIASLKQSHRIPPLIGAALVCFSICISS